MGQDCLPCTQGRLSRCGFADRPSRTQCIICSITTSPSVTLSRNADRSSRFLLSSGPAPRLLGRLRLPVHPYRRDDQAKDQQSRPQHQLPPALTMYRHPHGVLQPLSRVLVQDIQRLQPLVVSPARSPSANRHPHRSSSMSGSVETTREMNLRLPRSHRRLHEWRTRDCRRKEGCRRV